MKHYLTTLLNTDALQLFGIDLINQDDFYTLIIRFVLNITMLFVLVRLLYYPKTYRKDYVFTFLMLGMVIFFVCILLANVKLQMGFALGLFAVFGIIRYRTDAIPIKEMSYLFLVIAISLINAIASKKISYAELLFSNIALFFITLILEKGLFIKHLSQQVIVYEKINLIKPVNRDELIADLKERTGLDIVSVEVGKIDFLKDIAWLTIHYPGTSFENNAGSMNFMSDDDD